jgi:starch phosphorylase
VESDTSGTELGEPRQVAAQVSIGPLSPDEVSVQLVHGPVGQNDEITAPAIVPMEVAGDAADGHLRYTGSFTCERPGRYGFAVRVVPNHPDLVTPVELGLVASA